MSEVVKSFADGEYRFRMAMPQVVAFETEHDTILDFWGKLSSEFGKTLDGEYQYVGGRGPSVSAMRDYVRLALIGGNEGLVDGRQISVSAAKARDLVDAYLFPAEPFGVQELTELAFTIAHAAVKGINISSKKKTEKTTTDPPPDSAEA